MRYSTLFKFINNRHNSGPARAGTVGWIPKTITINNLLKLLILLLWAGVNLVGLSRMSENIYINASTLLYTQLVFATYLILARFSHVVTVMYVLIGVFFVLQRMLFVFLDPTYIDSSEFFFIEPKSLERALVFILLCNIGAISVSLISSNEKRFVRSRFATNATVLAVIQYYPWIYIVFWIIKTIFMFETGIGFKTRTGGLEFGVLNRLINMGFGLPFLLYLGVLYVKDRKMHVVALILLFIHAAIFQTSKAALMFMLISFLLTALMLGRNRVPVRYVTVSCVLGLVTIFTWAPLAMALRSEIVDRRHAIAPGDLWSVAVSSVERSPDLFGTVGLMMNEMSRRLALAEWLAGLIHFGREAFSANVNTQYLFESVVNSMVPGELLEGDYMPTDKVLSLVMKSFVTEQHGEIPGIYGGLYLYAGFVGGIAIFTIWYWMSLTLVQRARGIVSFIILTYFVLDFMVGGLPEGIVPRVLDNVAMMMLLSLLVVCMREARRVAYVVKCKYGYRGDAIATLTSGGVCCK